MPTPNSFWFRFWLIDRWGIIVLLALAGLLVGLFL